MGKITLIICFLSLVITSFSQNYDAELVSQKTTIIINKGKLTKNSYNEIKINSRLGEKHTKVTIPYSNLNKLSNIEAFIKDSDGRVVKRLKNSEIITRSSFSDFSFFEDRLEKAFTLKHNSYPYTIVYSYQIQKKEFLYIDNWIPVIDQTVPTLASDLIVSVPLDYGISYSSQYIEDFSIDTLENRINYKWSTSYTQLIKPELYSPPYLNLLPSVAIVPHKFSYEKEGSFADWISYGNWQFQLLQGLNELPDNEKRKIHSLLKDVSDDKEKIKILYHYLQDETRYVNVTIETGGLKPYQASYVAHNKYGDCKALTNYFKSLLDFIDIPSYYTKVFAGNPVRKIDKDFPSQQFNHVILYIPYKEEDIWLDCTSDAAFNYLGTFTQNRAAFIIDNNKSIFKQTPKLKPDDVLVTRKIEVKYDSGHSFVKFNNTYRGDSYESIINIKNNFNEQERDRTLRGYLEYDGFKLLKYNILNSNRDSTKIGLYYEVTSQNIYKQYGTDILVRNVAFPMPNFERPKDRTLPVQIDYPIYAIDTLIYEIPIGYTPHFSKDNYSITCKYGEYKLEIVENKRNIFVIKSMLIFSGFYHIPEYENFYNFYMQIVDIENKTHLSLIK
jgi:hypothetical protein